MPKSDELMVPLALAGEGLEAEQEKYDALKIQQFGVLYWHEEKALTSEAKKQGHQHTFLSVCGTPR